MHVLFIFIDKFISNIVHTNKVRFYFFQVQKYSFYGSFYSFRESILRFKYNLIRFTVFDISFEDFFLFNLRNGKSIQVQKIHLNAKNDATDRKYQICWILLITFTSQSTSSSSAKFLHPSTHQWCVKLKFPKFETIN